MLIRLILVLLPSLTLAQDVWEQLAPPLLPQSEYSVAEVNGEIYIMGGYPEDRITRRSVQIYNVNENTWRMGPDLPLPNNHGTAEVVNGIIYLIGGATGSSSSPGGVGYQDAVWALDPQLGKWVQKSPMPTKRRGLNSAVINGKIYVAGGQPPQAFDFAVYDPAIDRWEVLPELPYGPNHFVVEAINGKFHAFGGRLQSNHTSELTDIHAVYNPVSRTWSMDTPVPRKSSGNNGILAYGCFHLWGGEGGGINHDEMMADHFVYDPRSKTWTSLPDMQHPIHGVTGAAFVEGVIYAPGGGIEAGGRSGAHINQAYQPIMRCDE